VQLDVKIAVLMRHATAASRFALCLPATDSSDALECIPSSIQLHGCYQDSATHHACNLYTWLQVHYHSTRQGLVWWRCCCSLGTSELSSLCSVCQAHALVLILGCVQRPLCCCPQDALFAEISSAFSQSIS
jgi:hypothetical protein